MFNYAERLCYKLTGNFALLIILLATPGWCDADGPPAPDTVISSGGALLNLVFQGPPPTASALVIQHYIQEAADAVSLYYGRFPVRSAHIILQVSANRDGILKGTTWGGVAGVPALTRLRIGQQTSAQELGEDWIATHELVHMALPSLPDQQHWLEEGIASYVEPVARVQAGQLTAERMWRDMITGMPNGEPEPGDRGLNQTHTWGRTYWGGALFCLMVDVEIRRQTRNTRGLQDALRAVVNAGGTIDKEWPIERTLEIGDAATGTSVLRDTYRHWSEAPVSVDLPGLWKRLGVAVEGDRVVFNDHAALASIRKNITAVPRK